MAQSVRFVAQGEPMWMLKSRARALRVAKDHLRPVGPGVAAMLTGVVVSTAWIEAPLGTGGEWTIAYRLVPQKDQPVVAELRVFPTEADRRTQTPGQCRATGGEWSGAYRGARASVPPGGLTAPTVRGITLLRHLVAGKDAMAWVARQLAPPGATTATPLKRFGFPKPPKVRTANGRTTGRPPLTRTEYAVVAAHYVAALEEGSSRPVADVALRLRKERSKVRDMVRRARELGLLSEGLKRGKVGGVLTPEGIALVTAYKERKWGTR